FTAIRSAFAPAAWSMLSGPRSPAATSIRRPATSSCTARASTTATSITGKRPAIRDFLSKLAGATEPPHREDWYNRHVAALDQELGAFDDEGLFMAEGIYWFGPDNARYEGSLRLLFDEPNHPVSKHHEQEMTKAQRARWRWRRCYQAVLLLHGDAAGERFVVVG